MHKISRRQILASGAAASAALPAMPAIGAVEADAELIAVGKQLDIAYPAFLAMDGVPDDVCNEAYDRCCAIIDQIEALPAHTLAGLRVKARAIRWIHDDDAEANIVGMLDPGNGERPTTDVRLAKSIITQLLRVGG